MLRIVAVLLLTLRLACGRRVHETKAAITDKIEVEHVIPNKTIKDHLTNAKEAALKRLDGFKAEVLEALGADEDHKELVARFGNRDDQFYLRFLTFNEVYEKGKNPGNALTMLVNYAKFINMCRVEGFLKDLGAEAIRPYMHKGFLRMLSTRDKSNRRIILTSPYNMDEKVPEYWRTRMYLYWLLKLMTFEDTMEPGLLLMHDFTDVTATRLFKKIGQKSDAKKMLVDNTFPWILSKIIFVNVEWKLKLGFNVISAVIPASVKGNVEVAGDISNDKSQVEKYIDRAALPTGSPYDGDLDEPWDAALSPGLGVFFEPEMDPQENV